MAYKVFDFDASFRFGIEDVDNEHVKLVDMLNHVSELLDEDKFREAVKYFTKTLSNYVDEHFTNEEAFMKSFNYPDLEMHKRTHVKFQEAFNELKPKIEKYDEAAFRKSLLDTFLWLISHTGNTDKKYAEYYLANK